MAIRSRADRSVFGRGCAKTTLSARRRHHRRAVTVSSISPPRNRSALWFKQATRRAKYSRPPPVICKARPLEIVNLTPDGVFRGPSEFKQLQERLAPILRREQIRIEALEAEDVELLACAHDLNPGARRTSRRQLTDGARGGDGGRSVLWAGAAGTADRADRAGRAVA